MANHVDGNTYVTSDGWPLTVIDNDNWLAHGALYFEMEGGVCAVGGSSLVLLHKVMGINNINTLATEAWKLVTSMPQASASSGAMFEDKSRLSGGGKLKAVYSMVAPVADLQYYEGNLNGGVRAPHGYAKVTRESEKTLAEIIDIFYSGMPKKGEKQVQNAISKATKQVVEYFAKRGFKKDSKLRVPFYFTPTVDGWAFGLQNVIQIHGAIERIGGAKVDTFITPDGERKITSPRVVAYNGHSLMDGSLLNANTTTTDLNKFMSVSRGNQYNGQCVLQRSGQGGSTTSVLFVKKIAGTPLHALLGALAGKHLNLDGSYNPPEGWADLDEDFITKTCGVNATYILDSDVLVQGAEESAGDYLARQKASEKIIASRESNVRAPLNLLNEFSYPMVMEVCDRALIGGDLYKGNARAYTGQVFVDDAQTDSSLAAKGMEHSFSKSF